MQIYTLTIRWLDIEQVWQINYQIVTRDRIKNDLESTKKTYVFNKTKYFGRVYIIKQLLQGISSIVSCSGWCKVNTVNQDMFYT